MTNFRFVLCACGALALAFSVSCNKAADDSSKKPAASSGQAPVTASAPHPSAPAMAGMPSQSAGVSLASASFKVEGMHCADCTAAITQSLSKISGVKSVSADWQKGSVLVNYEPGKVQTTQLSSAIEALKYKVTSCNAGGNLASCPACPAGAAGATLQGVAGAPVSDPAKFIFASQKLGNGHLAATYHLSGMMCTDCEKKVTTALSTLKGVDNVKATWKDNTVVVTYDPAQANPVVLLATLRGTGFGIQTADGKGNLPGAAAACPAGKECPGCKDADGCKDGDCKDEGKDGKAAKTGGDSKPKTDGKGSHA